MLKWIQISVCLLIVLAGAFWFLAWVSSTLREAKGSDWSVLKRIPIVVAAAWIITAIYSAIYYAFAIWIGGTPDPQHGPNGPYSLSLSGKSIEVSREVYIRSEIAEGIMILLLVGSLVLTAKLLPKKPAPTQN